MSSSEDPRGDSHSPHSHREILPQPHYPNRHTLWPHSGSFSLSLSLSQHTHTHQITMHYKFSPPIALSDGKEFETSSSIPRSRIRWSPNWSKKIYFFVIIIHPPSPPPPTQFFFHPQNHQFDVKYVLLFYYYGGMVYTCLHDYLKALLFYTVVSWGEI